MSALVEDAQAQEIGALLFRARRRLWSLAAEWLAESGDSNHVLQLLWFLSARGPLTQRELAELMGQHPAGVSRLVDELEGRKFVRRKRSKSDRRCYVVTLTRGGEKRLADLQPAFARAAATALGGLSAKDRSQLRTLLLKMVSETS